MSYYVLADYFQLVKRTIKLYNKAVFSELMFLYANDDK